MCLEQADSPYTVQEDVLVEREGELVIQPGVQLRLHLIIYLRCFQFSFLQKENLDKLSTLKIFYTLLYDLEFSL